MKNSQTLIFVVLVVFWCSSCSKNDQGSQTPGDSQDITTSDDISPYGGALQITDESGNVITLTFPPGAIRDTTTVTLTIPGQDKDLPIDERQMRAFEIQPYDLSLYKPAIISVEYQSAISEIEESAIFRLRSDDLLTPLSDHTYPDGNRTITANTLILGEFAEGKMTIDQINAQLDLLVSSMGITLKSTDISDKHSNSHSSGCEEYKALWDDWTETAGSFMKFFSMRYLLGYYEDLPPGARTFEEDLDKVCENIVEQGVNAVLQLGEPNDPCCSDYAQTMESMMKTVTGCGIQGSTLDQMNERYNNVHSQCHTYLDITTELNVVSGGLLIMTTGEVMVTLEGTGDGEATVTGTGELTVTGSGSAGGECSATVSGQTFVSVSGTRDAAYVYMLTLGMNQVAMMTTVCPDMVVETPLIGGSPREVTLSPGNGFSLSETEMIDEGTVVVQISLQNPYVSVPEPE
jgi:hypothetical protein